jgi:DegV family protein with EDD domain
VDSSSCLPPELLRKWSITVVPHLLIVGGQTYRDGVDLLPRDFYQMLREQVVLPTTAAPSPQEFLDAFLAASEIAKNVLCITLSANFSVAYNSALAAVEESEGKLSHCGVKVVDSQAAAGASGLIALAAARWAQQGQSLDEVAAGVAGLTPKVNLLAFLDTLYFLRRGGRVGRMKAWTGSLLGVKPITELRRGQAWMLERPRGRPRAIARLVDIMRQRVGRAPVQVNVMEADAVDDARAMLERIGSNFNCRELFISEFTPVMGTHTGPGLLGIAFYVDDGELEPSPGT